MAMGMTGFTFGGGAEHGGDIVVAFDIGLLREVQITAIGLRLASEGGLQVVFGLGAFERHGKPPDVGKMAPGGCRGSTRITRCNALGKSIVCIGLIEVGYDRKSVVEGKSLSVR